MVNQKWVHLKSYSLQKICFICLQPHNSYLCYFYVIHKLNKNVYIYWQLSIQVYINLQIFIIHSSFSVRKIEIEIFILFCKINRWQTYQILVKKNTFFKFWDVVTVLIYKLVLCNQQYVNDSLSSGIKSKKCRKRYLSMLFLYQTKKKDFRVVSFLTKILHALAGDPIKKTRTLQKRLYWNLTFIPKFIRFRLVVCFKLISFCF